MSEIKVLKESTKPLLRRRDLITYGLPELYSGRTGEAGDIVVLKLGNHWDKRAGWTYIARIVSVDGERIKLSVLGDSWPDDGDSVLITRWSDAARSAIYLAPDIWLTHEQSADEPPAPPEPEKTLFQIMCEYDAALATLQSLKPGYDVAHERFLNARVALGAALAKHKDL